MADPLLNFGIVILLAAISGAIAIRLRQPPVLGLLVVGALAGPHQLGLVQGGEIISLLSEIGAVLLLFAIGLEFNLSKLKKFGLTAVLIGITKMSMAFMLGYLLGSLLGLGTLESLFLGGILSISSTAIVAKILKEEKFAGRSEPPLVIAVLIVEDLVAIFLLAVFGSIGSQASEVISLQLLYSILQALLIFGVFYLVLSKILRYAMTWLEQFQAEETLAFSAISLGIGLSYLAQLVGLPASIGAFLAGNLLAELPGGHKFKQAANPLIIAFSALFFISIGMLVNLQVFVETPWLIAGLLVGTILLKFAAMSTTTFFFGGNAEKASFSGLAMLPVGEFSLLIAASAAGLALAIDLTTITSILVFFTALASTSLISSHVAIRKAISNALPETIKERATLASRQYASAIDSLTYSLELPQLQKTVAILTRNAALIAVTVGLVVIALKYNTSIFMYNGYNVTLLKAVIAGVALAIVAIAIETTIEIKRISSAGKWLFNTAKLSVTALGGSGVIIFAAVTVIVVSLTVAELQFREVIIAVIIISAILLLSRAPNQNKQMLFFKEN